jgi:hypothetical protein
MRRDSLTPIYNPSLPALFSRNRFPSRIYRLTICTDLCPVWFMIDRSLAPAIAALVGAQAIRVLRRLRERRNNKFRT